MGKNVRYTELDAAPEVFHHPEAGRYAAEALHRKMRQSLVSLPEEQKAKTWQFLIFISWCALSSRGRPEMLTLILCRTRNGDFVKKLISSGLIASVAELDDFVR